MTPIPQRNPRTIRLLIPQLLFRSIEVDDFLELGVEPASGGREGEGLRDGTAGLIDSGGEGEGGGGDGEVGACRSCWRAV